MHRFSSRCKGYPSVSIVIRVLPQPDPAFQQNGKYEPAAPRTEGKKRKPELDLEDIPEEEEDIEAQGSDEESEIETDSEDESTLAGPDLASVIRAFAKRSGLKVLPLRKDDVKSDAFSDKKF